MNKLSNSWKGLMLNSLQRNSKGKRECSRKTEKRIKMTHGEIKAYIIIGPKS